MEPVSRRTWRYLAARVQGRRVQRGDPRVQLEQAIAAARAQHHRLREHAASVLANEKQAELRLERVRAEIRQLDASIRETLRRAAWAERAGRQAQAADLNRVAEAEADRLVGLEAGLAELETRWRLAAEASEQAKAAVRQSASLLQRALAEREQLLGRLDEAALLAQLNRALEMPSLDEVRVQVDERYARAAGTAEVAARTFERRMLSAEDEHQAAEARRRLARIRSELGPQKGDPVLERGEDAPA